MGLFDKGVVCTGKGLFSSENDPNSLDSLNSQINNASTRIQDAGYSPGNIDDRNAFEKFTNLPQGQNWFLDALELLGRGGNAVKNVIDKNVTDQTEGFGESLYKGLSGQEKVTGADLAEKMGIENKVGKFIVGTGLDIGLDPTTYIPGGVIAKGIGSVAKPLGSLSKGIYSAAEAASPTLKGLRENTIEPIFNSTKDTLGHALIPQYKWDQTLSGGTDDTLKNLFRETNNTRDFMNEESLKNIGNIAKTTGLDAGTDVGRLMEKDVVMNGPRPLRQLSTEPEHLQATKDLIDSNDALRQWATDNDIPLGEIDGYMRHILSEEERAFRKTKEGRNVDRYSGTLNNPDKHVLDGRKYLGSAEDVNDQVGRKMFEPNAYFATAIGQKKLIDYGNAVKFRRDILSNPEFAVKFRDGMTIPDHAELIDTNNYQFMKNPTNNLPDEIGGKYVVTKGVKEALDRFQGLATDEGTKGVLKAYDNLQGTWKKMALLSGGFHVRNAVGALFNNSVAGMNAADLVKYTTNAGADVFNALRSGNESAILKEFRQQGLGSSSISKVEFGKAGEAPEKGIINTVENLSKTNGQRLNESINPLKLSSYKNIFKSSQSVGEASDQVNRLALYKWARDRGMTPEKAAAKVREVQFDYTELTPFERNIAKRVMPFYTWSRKNIPFQIQSFINDPRKYAAVNKARLNAQDVVGLNDNNVPDYMKENFSIPFYGSEGKGKMLGLNLPLGDLTKLSNPGKVLVDSASSLIKTPAELALNYNTFRGKPIQKFEGQEKKYQVPFTNKEFGIPIKTAYALEQATGQIGRGLSGFLQKPESVDQDTLNRLPSLGISSMSKDFDAKTYAKYKKMEQLRQLQELMLYIQQQEGQKPRTLADIKKQH